MYGPTCVSTPCLVDDIQRYFYPEGDVGPLLEKLCLKQREKIEVLAERFEFIEHLRALARMLQVHKRQTPTCTPHDETHLKVTTHDEIIMCGHDYAGVDYDLEALIQYLLLTCIDTIKGDLESRDGYTGRFVAAFTTDLSPQLKHRFAEGFAVLRVVRHNVVDAKVKAWVAKTEDVKVKALADKLYDIRSRFSHNSIRSFFPVCPVNQIPKDTPEGEKVLIKVTDDEDLFRCLWDSVVFLTRKLLLELPEG
jgi:hypothetical protein